MIELKNLSYCLISYIFLMDKHADKQKETVHCRQPWKECGVPSYTTPRHYSRLLLHVNLSNKATTSPRLPDWLVFWDLLVQ